jgi:hypothetical protein
MDALRAVRASILQGRGTEGIPVRVLVWTRTSATPATGHKCRKHALTASLLFPAPAPHHDLPPLGRRRRPPSRLRACQAAADRLPACRLRHRPLSVRAPPLCTKSPANTAGNHEALTPRQPAAGRVEKAQQPAARGAGSTLATVRFRSGEKMSQSRPFLPLNSPGSGPDQTTDLTSSCHSW